MKFIIGLGNPGKKYEKTRHNVGFRVVDKILNSKFEIPNKFEVQNHKFKTEIAEGEINGKKVLLVKPQTFMNESGVAVRKLIADRGAPITDLVVIHDDVDLPFGTVRIKKGGGAAGHHGIESVIKEIGSNDFIRVRVGIGKSDVIPTDDFVLMPFGQDEAKQLPVIITRAVDTVISIITSGLERAMNVYNGN